MKKLFIFIMALCLIAPMAQAELGKKELKKIEKNARTKEKELKKEGFTVMGSFPLREALVQHYIAIEEGKSEQMGNGRAKSKNNGRQMCLTNALAEYSSKAMSQIKGRSVTDSFGDEVDMENNPEFAKFYAAYERLTEKEIKGELTESFTVMKQLPDGSFEFRMYLLLDEDKAYTARQKALRDAAAESKLSQDYAKQISEFINKN